MESLGRTRIKVVLSKTDLEKFGLDYEKLSCQNTETRALLSCLLETAACEFGFKRNGRLLSVRSLPVKEGCVMYMTLLGSCTDGRMKVERGPFLYEFENGDDLLCAADSLCRAGFGKKFDSRLFRNKDKYRLLLIADREPPPAMEHILTEFSRRCGKGTAAAAYAGEHFELLVGDNAIQKVGVCH